MTAAGDLDTKGQRAAAASALPTSAKAVGVAKPVDAAKAVGAAVPVTTEQIAALDLPKLVASDLDGTLLTIHGTVSDPTAVAVRRLQAAGIEFVIATARPPRWVHELTSIVDTHGLVICSNGAYVYDVARRAIIDERGIERAVVAQIVADLRQAVPSVTFAVERRDGFGREPEYTTDHPTPAGAPIAAIEQLLDPLPGKLLARAPDVPAAEFLDIVTEVVGEHAVMAFSGSAGLAEISAAGVTKAAVLAEWCAARDVAAAEVWAFGDMPNDLAMLEWAGVSFAVANAHPDVAARASYVCASHDEDGVAQVLSAALDAAGHR